MKICTKHTHATEERARKCYVKAVGKRADRAIRRSMDTGSNVEMRKNSPPRMVQHGRVWMIVFEEDANMPYGSVV